MPPNRASISAAIIITQAHPDATPLFSFNHLSPLYVTSERASPPTRHHPSPLTIFGHSKMREVLSLHVGQAGIQIGNACWEVRFWHVLTV